VNSNGLSKDVFDYQREVLKVIDDYVIEDMLDLEHEDLRIARKKMVERINSLR
jgi:hypothetical protein